MMLPLKPLVMAPTRFSLTDPEWLAHRFVESDDAFRFIRVPRGDHDAVPFLTDEYLGPREAAPDVSAVRHANHNGIDFATP